MNTTNKFILQGLFGLPGEPLSGDLLSHYTFTTSGRAAEGLFFKTSHAGKRKVLQNALSNTSYCAEGAEQFERVEIPDQEIFNANSKKIFRGGIDIDALKKNLEEQSDDIEMILLELCNETSGGYPVSLKQIKEISKLGAQYQIPLVMDITRILRNSELIHQYEDTYQQSDLYSIFAEIVSYADCVFGSLRYDFGLNKGGIIGAKDSGRIDSARALGEVEGSLVNEIDKELILARLKNRNYLEEVIREQLKIVKKIHEELALRNVPVMQPGVGHSILVRVKEIDGYQNRQYPKESFLRMLYEKWGIRGSIHLVGNQKATILNQCIRLAIPVGLNDIQLITYICDALNPVTQQNSSTKNSQTKINFIDEIKHKKSLPQSFGSDIAIIGLSGRYAQAKNVEEFWENLKVGKTAIDEIPENRWDWKMFYHANPNEAIDLRKSYGKWGGFLDGYDQFDAQFFKISSEEAEYIDPQERLFLEECWCALEDAGYRASDLPADLRRRAGVFGGVTKLGFNLSSMDSELLYFGTSLSSMVCRVSYCLDLKGPSKAIDSHCSSSLVAIHDACEYIRSGKGDLALAGGVNLNLHPSTYLQLSRLRLISQDSSSAAFSKGGVGYVPGEGVGVVVLKNYTQAIQDRDDIYAVIRGTAVNQNGKMGSFGRPNQKQQQAVISEALSCNAIDPRTISYIEAAAYGSELGDAIEVSALTHVFGESGGIRGSRRMGSVKPNVGHCEAASGMSQLTKVMLSLKYKTLAPTLITGELNPTIDFDRSPFQLQTNTSPWNPIFVDDLVMPRRAGISAFGGGGVNAHIILEEHISEHESFGSSANQVESNNEQLFILSARNNHSLQNYVQQWILFLEKKSNINLQSVSYTLQIGREFMDSRLALVFTNKEELIDQLKHWSTHQENNDFCYCGDLKTTKLNSANQARSDEIQNAIKTKNWRSLGKLWVQGNFILWNDLYKKDVVLRVNGLPTYPFAYALQSGFTASQPSVHLQPQNDSSPQHKASRVEDFFVDTTSLSLKEKTLRQLAVMAGDVFGIAAAEIDSNETWENYGIDSAMIVQLNHKLTRVFGEVSKTLFFECYTLKALTDYFVAEYPEKCIEFTAVQSAQTAHSVTEKPLTRYDIQSQIAASRKIEKRPYVDRAKNAGNKQTQQPIAIIGISGRYPQAKNIEEYWNNLTSGKDCVQEIPHDRWSLDGFFYTNEEEALAQGKSYSKWGGFIDGFSEFDPLFFKISPRDALNMDPQERVFLQCCWEMLEDAGYTRAQLSAQHQRKIGVFVGVTRSEFSMFVPDFWQQGKQTYPFTSFGSVANRVSSIFNLHGPSMPIDTMCSSSLTAVHQACEYLRDNESELAIAGGVNLLLHPYMYASLCAQKMLSKDGRCKGFGSGANGYVPGEGVGSILLKSLSKAVADQDHIYALIRATGINHGGKTNGYTVPSPTLQGNLIRETLEKAGVDARAVSYIEAHGTGTELGDPIEISGLKQAFQKFTSDTGFCRIGSVKSNIGHLESAAGIAGLTKILLQMKHKKFVPSLHTEELNPNIDFEKSPFVVSRELCDWHAPIIDGKEYPRIAGVSSFGAGGSNAHVLIEEYIPVNTVIPHSTDSLVIIPLSARTEEQLQQKVRDLLEFISSRDNKNSDITLLSMAYTLQTGREAMEERLGFIVNSVDQLAEKLQIYISGKQDLGGTYQGKVNRNKEGINIISQDEDMEDIIDKWIARKKLSKLLDLWVKGFELNWFKFYGSDKPPRISLPTYPFAKEKYWIDSKCLRPDLIRAVDTTVNTEKNFESIADIINQIENDLIETNQAIKLLNTLV